MNNEAYIISVIESKGGIKIDNIKTYDQVKLQSAKQFLANLETGFSEFFEFYKRSGIRIPIQQYNAQQAAEVKSNIKCYGENVFGWIPNGWILADSHVYFYFGNEHDFKVPYEQMANAEWTKVKKLFKSTCSFKSPKGLFIGIDCAIMEDYKLFFQELHAAKKEWSAVISKVKTQVDSLIVVKTKDVESTSKSSTSYSSSSQQGYNADQMGLIADHFRNLAHKLSGKPGVARRPTLICRGPYTENSLVAKIEDDYIFERQGIEETLVGRIDGDKIIRGKSWDGPVVAIMVGNKLVKGSWRDGEVIACIDGDRIIEGSWRDGRTIGRVIDGDMQTSLAGAAYLLLL